MKIIVDNKELAINNLKGKNFSLILDEVAEKLKGDGRYLFRIFIDGQEMDYYECLNNEQIEVVEFFSKTPKGIIMETLGEIGEFIPKYFEILMEASEIFNQGQLEDVELLLLELEEGLTWIYSVLVTIKENTAIDFKYPGFDIMVLEYGSILEKLRNSLGISDYVGALIALEVEMSGELIFLQKNLDTYIKELIEEEIDGYKYS